MNEPIDPEALKAEVDEAFRDVPMPASDRIVPHICDECWDLRDVLAGKTREDLGEVTLQGIRWDLPLLSDEATQYLLPLWLHTAIDSPRSDEADALLFAFDSDHRWDPEAGYTDAQIRVVAHFLEFMMDHVEGWTSPSSIAPSDAGSADASMLRASSSMPRPLAANLRACPPA